MSATDAAIGMMDGAYFTSRKEILDFLNTLLDLNLTKIEQTASGAVACQLTEYLFPNSIPMSKVDWGAKASHEYVANYKLLQSAFNKNKIRKHVDVDKLIRGKYQDNLEFCQWLKAFFDQTSGMMVQRREGYDAAAVRARGKGGKGVERSKGGVVGGSARPNRNVGAAAGKPRVVAASGCSSSGSNGTSSSSRPASSSSVSRTTKPAAAASSSRIHKENIANTSTAVPSKPKPDNPSTVALVKSLQEEVQSLKSINAELESKSSQLETDYADMELRLSTAESERDFYFNKLRGIELMFQVFKEKEEGGVDVDLGSEAKKVIERAFKVMYAAEGDNIDVDEEGNLIGDVETEEANLTTVSDNDAVNESVNEPTQNDAVLNQFSDDDLEDDELLVDDEEPEHEQIAEVDDSPIQSTPLADDSMDDDNLLSD